MSLYPIIKNHSRLWYRLNMDKVYLEPIAVAREKLLPLLEVPKDLHLEYQDIPIDGNFLVRLYKPKKLRHSPSPLIGFIRASAYALGTPDHYNLTCAHLANKSGCMVAGIEHRLSPEHPYPTPLDDSERAILWLYEHAEKYNLDKDKFALWGECSGANLSASVCHRLAKKQLPIIKKHVMLYPPLAYHYMSESKKKYGQGYMADLNLMDFTLKQYLTDRAQVHLAEVSPTLHTDFKGLPATSISVGEYDMFVDEVLDYTQKLEQAGIPVKAQVHPKLNHGFIRYYDYIPEVEVIIDQHVRETLKSFGSLKADTALI